MLLRDVCFNIDTCIGTNNVRVRSYILLCGLIQVHKTREQFGLEGPIAVHCASGGGRSGAFIALSIALERVRAEGLIDVFQTARLLRIQRAALVQLPQYYVFLYYALLAYLGAMVDANEQ